MFWLFRVALSAVNHAQTSRRRRPLSQHCARNQSACKSHTASKSSRSRTEIVSFSVRHPRKVPVSFARLFARIKLTQENRGTRVTNRDSYPIDPIPLQRRDGGQRRFAISQRGGVAARWNERIRGKTCRPAGVTRINHKRALQICRGVFLFQRITILGAEYEILNV